MNGQKVERHGAFGQIEFLGRSYFVERIIDHPLPDYKQVIELEDVETGEKVEMVHTRIQIED